MAGRKSKYDEVIKPNFPKITEWLQDGATEKQVALNLGIGYSTWTGWKKEKEELRELCKNARCCLVSKLRGALIQKAMGYSYTESKIVEESAKIPDEMKAILIEHGFNDFDSAKIVRTEIQNKKAAPDVAALNLALKNYDFENWANDPQMLALKKRELELKEKNNDW